MFTSKIIDSYDMRKVSIKRIVDDKKVSDHHAILPTEDVTNEKYTEVDYETSDFLQEKESRITEIRIKSVIAIGREPKEAQDRLANHYRGTFEKWVSSIGISDTTARNYINAFEWVGKKILSARWIAVSPCQRK